MATVYGGRYGDVYGTVQLPAVREEELEESEGTEVRHDAIQINALTDPSLCSAFLRLS